MFVTLPKSVPPRIELPSALGKVLLVVNRVPRKLILFMVVNSLLGFQQSRIGTLLCALFCLPRALCTLLRLRLLPPSSACAVALATFSWLADVDCG